MVLLIGNYELDRQQSMLRFGTMMAEGLAASGIASEFIQPEPFFGRLRAPGSPVNKWLAYLDKYVVFPWRLRKRMAAGPALIHICDHSNAPYTPKNSRVPVLVTCHDLLAVRGALGEETDCPASATGGILQRWILRGLRRATVIACDSLATLRDAERLVGPGPALKLVPIGLNYPYHAQPRESAIAQLGAIRDFTRPFVLHVGSGQRRKNREAVLRIFARCKNRWPGQLVFAGEKLSTEQNSLGEELGISADIIEIENPDNEMLNALYSAAAVLLFPSRFEGFGWPVIEAQACGCPVICSNAGPLAEVAGDGALLRDVEDEEGFAADLLRLLDPAERARWSEKSLRNASRFSAKKMIANYIDLYRTLAPAL